MAQERWERRDQKLQARSRHRDYVVQGRGFLIAYRQQIEAERRRDEERRQKEAA